MKAQPHGPPAPFLEAVLSGLASSPKTLPCRYFYDPEGSDLFEQICDLPEYYVTRTEDAILQRHACEIIATLREDVDLVELGSGSSRKTRRLIEALLGSRRCLRYVPVDISAEMLQETAQALQEAYPRLSVCPLALEYEDALRRLPRQRRSPMLLLFLGSNLGNFAPDAAMEFLKRIRSAMNRADRLLLGLDLHKDPALLNAAYDDAQGVTARFNLNLLRRINRELNADFDLTAFHHRAFYNEAAGRVEMHLVSQRSQRVRVSGREFEFRPGESIHTENSYKYRPDQVADLAAGAHLEVERSWQDENGYFSVNLLRPEVAPHERGGPAW